MIGSAFSKRNGRTLAPRRGHPVYDAMQADPARGIPAEQVMASQRKRHAERLMTIKREA
jgi:hypothetical protein